MRFTKKKNSLAYSPQRDNSLPSSIQKKRTSFKSNSLYSPNTSITRLPPVKIKNVTGKNLNECIKPRRKQSNLFMYQRIKFKQEKPSVGKLYQCKKNAGLSSQQLSHRKQNYMNTKYNLRKNKLIEITNENKNIYERINSQKSLYSSKDFDKSFQSNCSLSRRLSRSKISKISSRKSFEIIRKSPKGQIKLLQPKKQNQIQFGTKSIDKGQTEKVYRYMSIFCNRLILKKCSTEKQQAQQQNYLKMIKCDKQNKLDSSLTKIQKINIGFSQRLKRKMNGIVFHHFL